MTEKIHSASSWTLPPTGRQLRAITRLCAELHIKEHLENNPSNRWEARRLLYELNERRKWSKRIMDKEKIL